MLTFRYCQRRTPLISKNVETDASVCVDIWVIDLCRECHFRGFEGVVRGESDGQEKDTARVGRISLRKQKK
jgi:hypothetical protein